MNENTKVTISIAMKLIPGMSRRTLYRYIERVREFYAIPGPYVSVGKFCMYYGITFNSSDFASDK